LYADGNGAVPSVTEYRNIRLRAVAPDVIEVRPHRVAPRPVPITWRENGSGSISVQPHARLRSDQLVVVDESFAAGWKVDGTAPRAHVRVNGYANAWLVPPGTGQFDVTYGPGRMLRVGIVISLLAAVAAVGATLVRRRRARVGDAVFLAPTGELIFRPQSAPSRWLDRLHRLHPNRSKRSRISWRSHET
jgi:hypothetical protein